MKRCVLLILIGGIIHSASAQFTQGNIVVSVVGDGTSALSSAAAQVRLIEYTKNGTATGTVVALPIVSGGGGSRACTINGTATTEGFLNLSYDGRYLVHVGYDAVPGTLNVVTSASNFNRVIARIDAAGNVNTSTSFLATAGNAYVGVNIRSACSYDGTQFWASGGSAGSAGVRYLTFGQDGMAGTQISTTSTNTRNTQIFSNQLYTSTGAGTTFKLGAVGTGMPTISSQTITNLSGIPTSNLGANSFIFFDKDPSIPGLDLVYIACQSLNPGEFGLMKYSTFDGINWNAQGSVQTSAQLFAITGYIDCDGSVVLYTTRATTGNNLPTEIRKFIDYNEYNSPISNDGGDFVSTSNLIQSITGNYRFKGIAMAPGQGYTVTGTQNIAAGNYNVITVKSGGVATLTGNITIYDRLVVESGGTLIMGNYVISSPAGMSSSFTVMDGGKLKIAHPDGISESGATGNVQTCQRSFSTLAHYEYNGTVPQITGDGLPQFINSTGSLKINNTSGLGTSGVTLTGPHEIRGTLDLSLGKLTTVPGQWPYLTETVSLINYSINSFVEGPLGRSGPDTLFYPVGRGTEYAPIALTPDAGIDLFVAEYYTGNPRTVIGSAYENPPINHMSVLEWWTLEHYYGASDRKVILHARTYSDATLLTDLRVLRWDGSMWKNTGNTGCTGVSVGPVASAVIASADFAPGFTTPTPFTFGSVTSFENPLPINLLSFDASKLSDTRSLVNWELAVCCSPAAKFEIQRAGVNKNFTTINTVGGSATNRGYNYTDNDMKSGVNYYRLKMIDENGTISYSRVVAIMNGVNGLVLTSLIPTIVTNTVTLTVASSGTQKLDIIITDMQGKVVQKHNYSVIAGNTNIQLSMDKLAAGIYQLSGLASEARTNTIRFRKL